MVGSVPQSAAVHDIIASESKRMANPISRTRRTSPRGPWALVVGAVVLPAWHLVTGWWRGRRGAGADPRPMPCAVVDNAPVLTLSQVVATSHTGSVASSDSPGPSGSPSPSASGLALFHQLADAMPQLVSIMQADATQTYVNQRWADYTGVLREGIAQQRWSRFVHPDDLPQMATTWERAIGHGESAELEYRLLRADGQYCWMLGRAVPLQAETGLAGQWLVTSTDIDELKNAAAQLEKSITMKRLAGRVARLGGWTIELPDRVLTWSDENCLIHDAPPGYRPTLDEGISCFLPEHQGLVRQYVQACATHGTPYDFVLPKYTLAQRLIWVRSIGEAVRDASGQIIRIQGAFQDVTEQKQAEARTRALEQEVLSLSQSLNRELEGRVALRTAELARANHALESFAYAVSHDLRSPLNTIAGFIQLLLKADGAHVSPKGRHYLDRIAAGALQMGELIAGLLTLAHLSREEPQREAVDLSAMAERLAQRGQRQQPSRQAELRIQPGLQVQGDPRLLEVVLHKLLDNAWKFSARQSVTRIEVGGDTSPQGERRFFVKDNGVGFDMAFQHKLFGTFERLHAPGEFTGIGIGLATAKRVVESHGGRIWADSQVGQGAVFYFTLA